MLRDSIGSSKFTPVRSLELSRVTVTGGVSPPDQGGGGILSAGDLTLRDTNVWANQALGAADDPIRGGGLAVWDGNATIWRTWIDRNQADFGGGVFFGGTTDGLILQSTISHSVGGGFQSHSDGQIEITNSTVSGSSGGLGAIYNGKRDGRDVPNGQGLAVDVSADGRFIVYESDASNLVRGDMNQRFDVFVYDRQTQLTERVSVASDGSEGNGDSFDPTISSDGRYVVFTSDASNLVDGDSNEVQDIFIHDRDTGDHRENQRRVRRL